MADNRNNNLANAIAGWQATSGATSTSLTEPARARVADILSYPDNFEARRQVQNDFSSYAREAGDLSTQLDSPQFEKAVANKYSGFQAGQTNKMTAAANLIADSETANEVANRKIDNLTQQKELNDQKVQHAKNFMKAVMAPPIIGDIMGLFDDSYSMGKQLENLAYDESQLANLQTQDALDDQLVLQKAFGKAGYNPLANDVIEPANRWEKQYYDELTALQRNKISATSNKIAAKGGELEAYKAETARLKALGDILGDESKNARAVYEEAGKANERDRDYAQMGVDVYKQQAQTGRAILKSKDQQAQLVDNALQRESDMAIAQLKAASTAETNVQKGLATEAKLADIAERAEKRGTDLELQASKERIESSRSNRASETSATQRYVADQGLSKAKLELQKQELKNQGKLIGGTGSGAASGVKALTSNQISDLMSNSEAAVSSATKVMAQAPVLMAIDGGKLGNDPAVKQAYNELVSDSENLTKASADPTALANNIAADPVAQAAVKSANKRINANVEVIKSKADKVLGTGTSQSKEVTSIRLSNNGIVPASQRAVAENYLVSTDERSSSGTSIEGQIWNSGLQEALWNGMRELWASLPAETKGMVAKTTGIDPNDEKAVEKAVAQMVINMAEGGSVSGKSGGKDTKAYELAYKTLNPRAVLNDIVRNGYQYQYQYGTDENGYPLYKTVATSGMASYENKLSLDMTNYKASRIADNFNQQNGASIDTTFIGDENAEYTLGKRIIDAGFSPETAIATVDQFRLASLTKAWASDYQQRSVANDNIAASLMPVLGFTDFVSAVINDDSGQGNNSDVVQQQYDEIKEKIAAYGNYKIKEANYAAFIMNSINQSKKGK